MTHHAEELMAMIALSFVDLRAQYQAAMRMLETAERVTRCSQLLIARLAFALLKLARRLSRCPLS